MTDHRMPSLLDGLDGPAPSAQTHAPRAPLRLGARARVTLASLGGLGLGALAVWGVLALIPVQQPDYERDALDDVLGYTLLTTEFNQLPLEERVDLIGQVVKRFEAMEAGEGTLLAAFAAGIAGEARDQLEENAATLVIDLWDEYAPGYQSLQDPAEREAYLATATVGMVRLFERLDGDPSTKSDEEVLADARAQAERDRDMFTDPRRGPGAAGTARFMNFMQREVGNRATAHQRARITRLARDMTRYLRGEPIDGG
jgi:hypothetical protein